MRSARVVLLLSTMLCTTAAFAGPRMHRSPTAPKLFKNRTAAVPTPKPRAGIDADRATQIQSALIKAGYLTGQATGVWDQQSEAAMQKVQADNGWQTKLVPDARALNKLGLGAATPATQDVAQSPASEAAPESPAEAGVPANR